ncbi:MAG: hypothetical protein K2Q10_01470 [Rhodospirillales bacterium]|nr:hypothetical protein [Rhodospirillales bacterium]
MNDVAPDDIPPEELQSFLAYRDRVQGTNISAQTLLATDYLNHFNEIIMILEMIPDVPDCLEEARDWAPRSYQDHFRDSTFRDKELAIEAYDFVPSRFRKPFEDIVGQMNVMVRTSLERITAVQEDKEQLRFVCHEASRNLQKMIDYASAVIHGSDRAMDQAEIDGFMGR